MDETVWARVGDLAGTEGREVDDAKFSVSGATTVFARLTQRGSFCFSRFLQLIRGGLPIPCHRRARRQGHTHVRGCGERTSAIVRQARPWRHCTGAPSDRACCRMYPMNMAQRSSDPTDPTSTTCAHIGITSFADGIGDCGGSAGGVNGVGGGGGGGRGGDEHSATAAYAAWTCADAVDPLLGHPSKRLMHASAVQSYMVNGGEIGETGRAPVRNTAASLRHLSGKGAPLGPRGQPRASGWASGVVGGRMGCCCERGHVGHAGAPPRDQRGRD